jgi:hypothetical protein
VVSIAEHDADLRDLIDEDQSCFGFETIMGGFSACDISRA